MADETPTSPYRFPDLQEARAQAALRREDDPRRGGRSTLEVVEFRENKDGSVDEVYRDGHVAHYSAEEVSEAEAKRDRMEADQELVHGPPAQSLEDAVTVIHYSVPRDVPSVDQERALGIAADWLDRLDELSSDESDELCRLLNAYGAERWGMLPLLEVYQAPESWTSKRRLGYRLNALEAVVLPEHPYDEDRDEEIDGPSPWASDAGYGELDRILEVLADGSDETVDDTRLLCERAPTMGFYLVRNGRLYDRNDWPALYKALEGAGRLIRPVPEFVAPVLVVGPYQTEAYSVSALMEAAKRAMYEDDLWAARQGDEAVSDEAIAAMERLDEGGWGSSHQLGRIQRKRVGRDRVQETWTALLELHRAGRALLPDWQSPESTDEAILVKMHWQSLEAQLRSYHELNPELELEPLPERQGFAPTGAEYTPPVPVDPRPGHHVFTHFERQTWEDPSYWWTGVDRGVLEATRGLWVVLDQFYGVLAAGPDPEALKTRPDWRYVVSVPADGNPADGLVISNDAPLSDES